MCNKKIKFATLLLTKTKSYKLNLHRTINGFIHLDSINWFALIIFKTPRLLENYQAQMIKVQQTAVAYGKIKTMKIIF